MIVKLIDEAVTSGATHGKACRTLGLAPTTIARWRVAPKAEDGRKGPKTKPVNALSEQERAEVVEIMQENSICGRQRRKFKKTTDSNHDFPIAPNVLDRDFTTDGPDKAWVADITYIWTATGWAYLAVIIDLFSRRVVGWSMADHMRKELVLDALRRALGHRMPSKEGLVFHSDRGSQYASEDYRKVLRGAGISCSMSRRGNCWDNAVAESFFSTLKTELIYTNDFFLTHDSARTDVAEWIEVFYNRQRRHSTIDYLSPVDYENRHYQGVNCAVLT